MTHHVRSAAVAFVCTIALAGTAVADQLNISGIVRNTGGQAIAGAIVTAIFGTGGSARNVVDTTDTEGNYEINTSFSGGAGGTGLFQLSASAVGYLSSTLPQIVDAPTDGTPDSLAQNFSLTAGQQQAGDSLYVTGIVRRADSTFISGATVTVSILSTTRTQTATAVTSAQGAYTVAMINQNAGRSVTILVEAVGYADGTAQSQIAEPSDGTADRITRNFTLAAIVVDTLVVTGQVVDSATAGGLTGARIIISNSGVNGTVLDTIMSGTGGNYAQNIVVTQMPTTILWRVELAGYTSKNGQRTVTGDSAKIGTVALVAFATTDSIAYTVHGRATDSASGNAMRNIDVIVRITFSSELIILDTVTTNQQGNYTVTSARMPYQAGNNTVTVSAAVQGYQAYTRTVIVPTSTGDITMNIALLEATSVIRTLTPVRGVVNVNAKAYSINGRLIGSRQALDMYKAGGVVQPMIIRSAEGSVEKVVPVR